MEDRANVRHARPLASLYGAGKPRKAGGLSPADLAHWSQLKSTLNRHFQPDVQEKHAKSPASVRVPLALNVCFESRGEVGDCLMTNLSTGGIFIATESPLPIGTPFNVRIQVEKPERKSSSPAKSPP